MRTLLLTGFFVVYAAGQTPIEPPLLIQVIRAPGNADGPPVRSYSNAGAAVNVFGMRSVTGLPETWLMEAHDSFLSIEELDKAIGAGDRTSSRDDPLAMPRTLIALYRPAWSYRSAEAIKLYPKARYFLISLHRIRPGADNDFLELIRQRRSGFDRINLDRPDIAYQVVSGAPSQMYLFLAPLTSLKTLDDALDKIYASLDARPRRDSGTSADVEISREYLLFRVEPRISWVSEGFVSADPDFWGAKKR